MKRKEFVGILATHESGIGAKRGCRMSAIPFPCGWPAGQDPSHAPPGQLATMLGGAQNAMSRTAAASKPT